MMITAHSGIKINSGLQQFLCYMFMAYFTPKLVKLQIETRK